VLLVRGGTVFGGLSTLTFELLIGLRAFGCAFSSSVTARLNASA